MFTSDRSDWACAVVSGGEDEVGTFEVWGFRALAFSKTGLKGCGVEDFLQESSLGLGRPRFGFRV